MNATALAFVLDLDELMYNNLIPPMSKCAVANVQPLKQRKKMHIRGLSWQGPLIICMCIVYISINMQEPLRAARIMQRFEQIMCGHNPHFVVDQSMLGYAVIVPTSNTSKKYWSGVADEDKKIGSLLKLAVSNFTRDARFSTDAKLRDFAKTFPSKDTHPETVAAVMDRRESFFRELRLQASEKFTAPYCGDAIDHYGELYTEYLWALRYATQLMNATGCESFTKFCKQSSDVGWLVRTYCSRSCQCNSHMGLVVDRSGCNSVCDGAMRYELRNIDIGNDLIDGINVADCVDWPKELLNDPNVSVYISQIMLLFGITDFSYEKFKRWGCNSLTPAHSEEVFGNVSADILPDILCGRDIGTYMARRNLDYMTLRWICPIACGCSIDMSDQCPPSCKAGPGSMASDECADGLCPVDRTLNSNELTLSGDTCHDWDSSMRGDQQMLTQKDCALIKTQFHHCCV